MKVGRLDGLRDDELFGEKLEEIIMMQETAYRSAERLKRAFSPLLLLLYGSCIASLCTTMMVLTIVSRKHFNENMNNKTEFSGKAGGGQLLVKMIVSVWYTFFLIFSFSMLGTELTEASSSIADAVYETCWYNRPVNEQRLLMIVMLRSQRGAYLTATKFFVVNRASFAMAIESAYSYFTILRQFFASH
ncbi:odorant receptor 49b-like [Sabethes cyaneus]|uniref:odorant receptor 49b-like n=1 Tax=Sabethes cyaneus TaxID=53552 RepID=UPI00237ECF4F|nr:odorant receptor 49b-like [Sabethes cyaneus]